MALFLVAFRIFESPLGGYFYWKGGRGLRKLKKYVPTEFMAEDSHYDKAEADFAVNFIENLCHTKGTWARKKFELMDWQEQIIRDVF